MSSKLIKPGSIRMPQPLCHINITSDDNGAVSAQFVAVGGFDRTIPAHAFAEQLMILADTLGKRLEVPPEDFEKVMEIPRGQVFS